MELPHHVSEALRQPYRTASKQILFLVSTLIACDLIMPTYGLNHPPTLGLSLALGAQANVMTVAEDTPINSLLALLKVSDPDSGLDGMVTCEIDNEIVKLLEMANNLYSVQLSAFLNRERVSQMKIDIICHDNGSPPLSQSAFFTIVVSDVNDNVPTFTHDAFIFSIKENADIGTIVGTVFAVDPDLAENGMVDYALVDENGDISTLFSIDEKTGIITSLQVFDREKVNKIELFVFGSDRGIPQLIGEANVTIDIIDENDNTPSILTKQLSIEEGQPSMSIIGTITAQDLDVNENAEIEFNLLSGDDGSSFPPFIVESNGKVFTAVNLDREIRNQYTIQISATDFGTPALSSTANINIVVLDVNDNPPVIFNPKDDDEFDSGNSSDSVVIDWSSPEEDKTVFQVIAADVDIAENGRIYYAIDSINSKPFDDDSLFDIDNNSGKIFLRRFVRDGDDPVQILSIVAYDGGVPSLNAGAELNVTLDIDFSSLTPPPPPTEPPSKPSVDDNNGTETRRMSSTLFLFSLILCLTVLSSHHFRDILF